MKRDHIEDIYELSPLQQGMLFHTLLTPGAGMYFEQVVFPLHGPLDLKAFERSWQTVLDRHTILRTSFHWTNVAKPLQVVYRKVKLPVEYFDWSDLPEPAFNERLESLLKADRERGFDLSTAPLLRLLVVVRAPHSRVIIFSLHHLLLDGWSSNLVYKEAQALYEAYCRGEELHLPVCRPYGDYIAWLQQQTADAAESYWRERLRGYAGPSQLGIGLSPAPLHDDSQYETLEYPIAKTITDALRRVARTHQLTLNTIVQGAWALLLNRYNGEEDIVFGATVSGRPAELEGIESMIGLFINTLPVRIRVDTNCYLLNWLRDLQKNQARAQQFEHVSLSQIHSWSEVPRNQPLFETLIGFENFPAAGSESPSMNHNFEAQLFSHTNYPITLAVIPSAVNWSLRLMYARPRFEPAVMNRLMGHFQHLLREIGINPMRKLRELSLLTEAEQKQLNDWNQTVTSYPHQETIHKLFEEQVLRTPNAIAVTVAGEQLTYDALNRRANRLGRRLRSLGVGGETVVAVGVESTLELITAMLGVLKAGAAYLPLDESYPNERLQFMLRDSGAKVLIGNRALGDRISTAGVKCITLEDETGVITEDNNLPHETVAENLAYVMYTSGSTGDPKGVAITHRAVIRTVRDTNYITLSSSDVIAQISNVCFDAATFEVWGALLNGAQVAGISRDVTLSPEDFRTALRDHRISTIFVTTDLFNQLVKARPDIFAELKNVLFGGSASDPKWIVTCLQYGRPQRLIHVYGPTESTTFASWYPIEVVVEGATSIPIGNPLANTQLYILDRNLSLVPVGVVGEIYIAGDGLARGYYNRPELTAEKFIPNPFGKQHGSQLYRSGDRARRDANGAIEFLGRLDDQIKIRGFRVELGEIETVLRTCPGVADAVVLARKDVPGTTRLVAYVVPANGSLTVAELRRLLETKLPDYMVPSAFTFRDVLPLTPNGKVDGKALTVAEERISPEESYTAPRTPAERTLASIWSQVLGVDRVGIHDNFFELGGDSIISIQIISRAREAGFVLTLRQLLQNQTVAKLAAVAGTETPAGAESGPLEGELPLLPVQHWFFEQQLADPHHFNHATLIETPIGIDPAFLAQATEHLVLHHDALRLRFRHEDGQWRQFYGPPGQTVFEVVNLNNVTPIALASRFEREATKIQESLNLETGPVVRVVWFDLGHRPGRLLFVIHHLVVDTVSWRILMEDFWQAYGSLVRGEDVRLPAKTSSLQQWSSRLLEHAQSNQVRNELAYWMAASSGTAGRVPLDLDGGENLVATADIVTIELDKARTRELLQETPKAYQTQINDVLLTALAQVLSTWTGERSVAFDLEGHGREPLFEDIDLTRTVGWFTTIFPVQLNVISEAPGELLKSIKEQLRQVPNRGLTYGLLRYLTVGSYRESLISSDRDVSFNYLGQVGAAQQLESTGQARSPRARRAHLLEINGDISDGRLRVDWEYSRLHHQRATIERLATEFSERVNDLITHCRSSQQASFTPSDFAQAGISQKELDKLVAVFDQSERSAG